MTIELNYHDWMNIIHLLEIGADTNDLANEYAKEKYPEKALPDFIVKTVSEDYRLYARKLKLRAIR